MNDAERAIDMIASDLVKASLAYGRDRLVQNGQGKLKTARNDYINSISGVIMETELRGKITLTGAWPVMLEEGFGPFDIKQGFSISPKRTNKVDGGWYATVPFRHRVSGDINVMPSNILKNARKLNHGEILSQAIVRELGYKPQTSWAGYTWSNSKYDGLQKFVKNYKSGAKRGHYVTFRRISDTSSPRSWLHPGFKGVKGFESETPRIEEFAYSYWEDSI